MAVFTSGELAMARAMRAAASSLAAPETRMVISLRAPSPSRAMLRARFLHHARDAALPRRPFPWDRAARRKRRWPAAAAYRWWRCRHPRRCGCSCARPPRRSMRRSMATGISASVSTKPSVVAMRGWIMPEPLVMPAMRTVPRRSLTSAKASLATRSVVRMARATLPKPSSREAGDQARQRVDDELGVQFHADHAGGSRQHLRRPAAATGAPRTRQQASATASPVRVAQLALPAFTRIAPAAPREAVRCRRQSFTGAACTRFCVKTRGGRGRQAGDDQPQVVFFGLADAGVGGGVAIAQRQVHSTILPECRFPVMRWPLAKASAAIRLRPSSCTSISSSAPSPQTTRSGWQQQLARRAGLRRRGHTRFPDVQQLAAKARVRAGPGLEAAHAIVDACAGWLQSMRPSSFFSSGA